VHGLGLIIVNWLSVEKPPFCIWLLLISLCLSKWIPITRGVHEAGWGRFPHFLTLPRTPAVWEFSTCEPRVTEWNCAGQGGADSNQSQRNHQISHFLDFIRNQTNHGEIIATKKHQPMDEDAISEPQPKVLKRASTNQPRLSPAVYDECQILCIWTPWFALVRPLAL
jgi:hypothetical protein